MKKRLGINFIAIFLLIALIAFGVIFTVSDDVFYSIKSNSEQTENVALATSPAGSGIPNANSNYGMLATGSTYKYTEYSKVSSSGTVDDLETVTVDSTQSHGSQKNPYVIDSLTRWDHLVTDGASDSSTATNGKVYVLTADLNFSSQTNFKIVNFFKGTFYGLGHTFTGMKYSDTASVENIAPFGRIAGATITDLNNSDFSFVQNNPVDAIRIAGIAGHAIENCAIYNCHTTGTLVIKPSSLAGRLSGIVGLVAGSGYSCNIKIYRCSTKIHATSEHQTANRTETSIGGMISIVARPASLVVDHCYAEVETHVTKAARYSSGSMIGVVSRPQNGSNNPITVQNCAGIIDDYGNTENVVSGSTATDSQYRGSLMGVVADSASDLSAISVKNTFTYGDIHSSTSTKYNLYAIITTKAFETASGVSKTYSNVWSGLSSGYQFFFTQAFTTGGNSPYSIPTQIRNNTTDPTSLWGKARTQFASANTIWTQPSNIGTNAYTIDKSPVKNTNLQTSGFNFELCDYKSDGSSVALAGTNKVSYTPVTGGSVSISAAADSYTDGGKIYRTLRGWTFNPTASNPTILSTPLSLTGANYYGNVKLYAVWTNNTNDITASVTTTPDPATATYGQAVTLRGNLATAKMPNPYFEYRWTKTGGTTGAAGTTQDISLTNVAQSGSYQLEYRLKSNDYPLWGSTTWVAVGGTIPVTINKADLDLDSFSATGAYVGMSLSELTSNNCTLVASSGGAQVSGAQFVWYNGATIEEAKVDKTNPNKMTYTQAITLMGPAGNENNYTTKQVNVTFDVNYVKFIFDFGGRLDNFEINGEYDQNYKNADIATIFDKAVADALAQNPNFLDAFSQQVPYFDGVPLATYRTDNTTTTNLRSNKTVRVTFVDQKYTVIFKDSGGNELRSEQYGYGQRIRATGWYTPPTDHVLLGWKYTPAGETTEKYWDESVDRVTYDVILTADTKQLQITGLKELQVTPIKFVYDALTEVTDADLTVKAIFDTNVGEVIERTLHLNDPISDNRYTIIYESGVSLQASDSKFTVQYAYGTPPTTVDVTVANDGLIIKKLDIDTSRVPTTVSDRYTGNKSTAYLVDNSIKPPTASSVTYTFTDEYGTPKTENEIIGDPENETKYIIIATFHPVNDNYELTTLRITLTILARAVDVKLVWEPSPATFPYNGQVQHPTAKVVRVDNEREVTDAGIVYSGDTEVSAVGSGYTVTASLTSLAYNLTGSDFCAFSIEIAELEIPSLLRNLTYTGENIDITAQLKNFDPDVINIAGDISPKDAYSAYSVTFTVKDPANYVFKSGNTSESLDFEVAKAQLTVRWDQLSFTHDGSAHGPKVRTFIGLLGSDTIDIDTEVLYSGTTQGENIGSYNISMTLADSVAFKNNYVLSGASATYTVVPASGNYKLVTVEWENPPASGYVYNGNVQHPSFVVKDDQGNDITASVTVTVDGGYDTSKWAKTYSCTVQITDASGTTYVITDGNAITYEIKVDADGNGLEPTEPDPGNGNNGNAVADFFRKLIEQNFPLWQICTIAVGALLSLIFLIKSIQYGNRKKKAKGEAKKISAKTYALLPVFDTAIVLAGLSNKIWSIIAFAMVGVTVLMFIIALITRKGWKKAELAKEQAIEDSEKRKFESQNASQLALQEKIAQIGSAGGVAGGADMSVIEEMRREMEEQRRADEERHRQEMEAMKLMLANMMGRSQMDNGDIQYASMDDTDLLVQKVIAGLLPAVQQMIPEPTAYLSAPNEQNDELKELIEQQSAQIAELQNQIADMSQGRVEGELLPDNSEELRAMAEEHNAKIEEQNAQIEEQNAQIAELQNQIANILQDRVEGELLPDQTEEIKALKAKIEELQQQIADGNTVVVNADNSEELRALADAQNAKLAQQNAEMQAMSAEMLAMRSQLEALSSMSVDELDDEDFDDEEEWDSILDEDDDDFVEAIIIEEDGKQRKVYPNFRMRLKQSSDKNREWYTAIKNMFCSQKGVTYRVYKRVEKIRYQGQVIAVIGIAKRSIKLWLALKPYEYDARRYHHKDVSDKPRFVDVPMYVRVTSDRALERSQELILALFQELNMEARKRYNDRSIQELIFTLKHNRLLTNKQNKQLLCETMHVHDCDVLDDETAEKCIEAKNVESLDESNIETVKLDDIDAKFQDGNRVTLDRLKKVGLVSEDCTGFTVTADKRLTKPLIIVANDFTLTAVKLIVLTGGRAIKLQTV